MTHMESPGALAGATGAGGKPSRAAEQDRTIARPKALRIIVRELANGNWTAATEAGELLIASSRTPFLDGARALLALGVDPAEPITMVHAKRPSLECFLPVAVGIAARLSVEEGDRSARIRKWRNPAERLRPVGAEAELVAFPHSEARQAAPVRGARK